MTKSQCSLLCSMCELKETVSRFIITIFHLKLERQDAMLVMRIGHRKKVILRMSPQTAVIRMPLLEARTNRILALGS